MLYLVGLGAGGAQELSDQALHALRRARRVFVVYPAHPTTRLLMLAGIAFEPCPSDPQQAVATLLSCAETPVALALPGHPLVANPLTEAILHAA